MVYYCNRDHQLPHWHAEHATECGYKLDSTPISAPASAHRGNRDDPCPARGKEYSPLKAESDDILYDEPYYM